MSELFDDISRIVGSQISRRQVLMHITRVLVGGALIAVRPEGVKAATPRPKFDCEKVFRQSGKATRKVDKCNGSVAFRLSTELCEEAEKTAEKEADKVCKDMNCPPALQLSLGQCNTDCEDSMTVRSVFEARYNCPSTALVKCKTDKDCVMASSPLALQTCPGSSCSGCCGTKCCKDDEECDLNNMRCVASNMRPKRRRP